MQLSFASSVTLPSQCAKQNFKDQEKYCFIPCCGSAQYDSLKTIPTMMERGGRYFQSYLEYWSMSISL